MDSILSYLGGKSRLSKTVISKIPEHTCYVEPFCGAAWVFFRKPESRVEILNDINSELVNLYRVIRTHYEEFLKCCEWLPVSRQEHGDFRAEKNTIRTLTDIERAVRYYYSMCGGFAGRQDSVFVMGTTRKPKFRKEFIEKRIQEANHRLSGVVIENLGYSDVINRYDRDYTFFYIDPPYYNCENDYGKGVFSKTDFKLIAELLRTIKGKFLLSLNDLPEVREIFHGFKIEEVEVHYSVCSIVEKRGKSGELLISNY